MAFPHPLRDQRSRMGRIDSAFRAVAACLLLAPAAAAADAPATVTIVPGSLENALTQLAHRAGWQILFDPAIVRNRYFAGAPRAEPPRKLLRRLLRDNDLRARWLSAATVLIVRDEPPPPPAIAQPPEHHENQIVVTALKRETVKDETALGLSVERGTALTSVAIRDTRTLARRHPELIVLDAGAGQQRLAMRGLVSSGEPTVGVYYDESPVSGPGSTNFDPSAFAPDLDLVDVDRVEVLRGPQGTLYGASAMGGVVRFIFNKPDPAGWHGEARAGIDAAEGAGPGGSGSVTLNVPLAPGTLAARATFYARQTGGYIENQRLGLRDGGRMRRAGGRLALAWLADARTTVQASVILQHSDLNDASFWYRDDGYHINNQTTRTPQQSDLQLYNITAQRDFGGVSALLTVSHYDWRQVRRLDYTKVTAGQIGDADACRGYFALASAESCSVEQYRDFAALVESRLPAVLYQPMDLHDWNGEFRLSSGGGATKWTAGFYLERRREHVASYALRADPRTGETGDPLDITGLRHIVSALSQQALFGEWERGLGGPFALTLGARSFHYSRSAGGNVAIPNPITGTGALEGDRYVTSETGSNLKAQLSWRPSGRLLLYAQVSQGFRPGGVNITPALSTSERAYRSDRLLSYEIGSRANAFGDRLNINANIYHLRWSNMIFPLTTARSAFAYNVNVGSAAINGAEAEATFSPDERTVIESRATLLHARLTSDQPIYTDGLVAHKGDALPNAPAFALAAALQRREPLSADLAMTARLDVNYTGAMRSTFDPASRNYERTPPHAQIDAQLLFQRGGWDVGVMARNLLGSTGAARISSGLYGMGQTFGTQPRTVSVELAYRF